MTNKFKITTKIIIVSLVILNLIAGFVVNNSQYLAQQITQLPQLEIAETSSLPIFSPSYVLSDTTFSSRKTFNSQQSIQAYLESIRSPLANYYDQGQIASYWIWGASNGSTNTYMNIKPNVNPAVILAFLEKEQSLLSIANYNTKTDPQVRLKWAMGMGCPDGTKCNSAYEGFANQVNWGAFQLQYNYNLSANNQGNFRAGSNIRTLDNYDVYLSNSASASVYRYTPHVYWGNYSLWKIITANGWGISDQKYTYSQLDSVNLQNKDKPIVWTAPVSTPAPTPKLEIVPTVAPNNPKTNVDNAIEIKPYWSTSKQTPKQSTCEQLKTQKYQVGQSSEAIKQLQLCMQNLGLFVWKYGATGYFGNVTKQSLIRWRGYF